MSKLNNLGPRIASIAGLSLAVIAVMACVASIGLAFAYRRLPDISALTDYRPNLPLKVYSAEGTLLGEYGAEHRDFVPIERIPRVLQQAVLAAEDARFYDHDGVDYLGVVRAAMADLSHSRSQGASTITMQVARNFYLSSEKTFTRKIFETLLAMKIDAVLSKERILEIYMNQIYLGQRAYGFATASETYFGKPLADLDVAEAAMLAGLPKAPSAYNPIVNPKRAVERQHYVINRMLENGYISQDQHDVASVRPLKYAARAETPNHTEVVTEIVRQAMVERFGDDAYSLGLNVTVSIHADDQRAAYTAVRRGILEYDHRQGYRGPEGQIRLPADPGAVDNAVVDALGDHPDDDGLIAGVALDVSPMKLVVALRDGRRVTIEGKGLQWLRGWTNGRLQPGAIVRVVRDANGVWGITQEPEVEGAFVAMDPKGGDIRALVGGFSESQTGFNRATQAWRQPGSTFKPFIYSAALEKGFAPATVVNDGPLVIKTAAGMPPWEPHDYESGFEGPMSIRHALAESKNMVAIRVLQAIGTSYAQQWVTRFGFDADRQPAVLPMALGAGTVTPLQLASAYSVFANGGYRLAPRLITRVTDAQGHELVATKPSPANETTRVIDARNAFVMDSMLQTVTQSGSGAKAQAVLKRTDLFGKTGTTNDEHDAWFAGFQPSLVAVAWVGYDNPRPLGAHEQGASLALPIWIDFMKSALKGIPPEPLQPPSSGLTRVDDDWAYDDAVAPPPTEPGDAPSSVSGPKPPSEEERKAVLQMFND